MGFSTDPYLAKAYDRRSYNCWHMLCEAWRDLTGEDLQMSLTLRPGQYMGIVERPVNPCVVVMINPGTPAHAGLYRNGRVLHIHETGARFERLADATRGYGEVRFYAKRSPNPRPAEPPQRD